MNTGLETEIKILKISKEGSVPSAYDFSGPFLNGFYVSFSPTL
jgi:hypothetical protein